jgi:hypothetical protein
MFSANMGKGVKVDGTASVGHFVTYFDRANQTGEVFAVTAKVLTGQRICVAQHRNWCSTQQRPTSTRLDVRLRCFASHTVTAVCGVGHLRPVVTQQDWRQKCSLKPAPRLPRFWPKCSAPLTKVPMVLSVTFGPAVSTPATSAKTMVREGLSQLVGAYALAAKVAGGVDQLPEELHAKVRAAHDAVAAL